MSARKDFYFRQRVSEAELDAGFDDLENADRNLTGDLGFVGVAANAAVSQHAPVPDLTVDVSGPGAIYDQLGQRIFFSALQTVNVGQDGNGVSTAVSAAGKEKIVSVFAKFDRALSDPRVDGNSLTVFFRRDESFQFIVVQGAEGAAGGASPPPLRSDAILLADVTRRFDQAQVQNEDISIARRQDAFALPGTPRSVRRGRAVEAIADLLSFYDAHVAGSADRHAAGALDYGGGAAWADGTANPAATIEAQLDKMLSDLAGPAGAPKIGAAATAGAPYALGAGTVKSQLDALLGGLNGHVTDPAAAHAAAAIAYGGGPAWRDGAANPAATVQAQLSKLVSDLVADAGATRLGTTARAAWLDGTANPPASVFEALNHLISDLSAQVPVGDGAGRVGARAAGNLPAGTVRSQLDALDATAVRTNVANVFAAEQTLNGPAGDTNAALATTATPTTRKLLWEIAGGSYQYRFYAALEVLELTTNARWTGTQWAKDAATAASSKLELNPSELRVSSDDASTNPFNDTWKNSVAIGLAAHQQQSFDAGGNWLSSGPTETFAGGLTGADDASLGAAGSFRKVFPATPSSITFVVVQQLNVASPPSVFTASPTGIGVIVALTPGNGGANFFTRILAT